MSARRCKQCKSDIPPERQKSAIFCSYECKERSATERKRLARTGPLKEHPCIECGVNLKAYRKAYAIHDRCRRVRRERIAKESKEKLKRDPEKIPLTEQDSYFYSLVAKPTVKKKRRCLRCKVEFLSASAGNRQCASCVTRNSKISSMMGDVYINQGT